MQKGIMYSILILIALELSSGSIMFNVWRLVAVHCTLYTHTVHEKINRNQNVIHINCDGLINLQIRCSDFILYHLKNILLPNGFGIIAIIRIDVLSNCCTALCC